ncbi:MAG: LLM class flavin-dependent oxidoreductase [Dehalococcoidia bacterium]|nr:LLM class flavin-dependent oxidoreductase [Dehalococcoidia bacterium]
MADDTIGVAAVGRDSSAVLAMIRNLEERGIDAAWLTTGAARPDGLTLLAAAAVQTRRIQLGTAIIPTWPRHPVAAVQQAQVVAQLAPARFRFGIGPSHAAVMKSTFGVDFHRPLSHLREYLHVVRTLLHEGAIEHEGDWCTANAAIPWALPSVPVMISALRPSAYELAGEAADGVISWLCPAIYLRDVALSALQRGAARAEREQAPPLIAHVPVCVHDDLGEAEAAFRSQFSFYLGTHSYPRMLAEAGFPEAEKGEWSERMVDAVLAAGDEERVTVRLRELLAYGVTEIVASVVTAGEDEEASAARTLDLLASLSGR